MVAEYCEGQTFEARCSAEDEVVLMQSALYGRMRLGRCINGDFNIGCSKSVLPYFDSLCSARETCDVTVRNLVEIHPCQRDFMSYLEASYQCIEGVNLWDCAKARVAWRTQNSIFIGSPVMSFDVKI